ncbi:MAG: hypothetical protein ABI837_01210 [Acidobacteriota bacterium]
MKTTYAHIILGLAAVVFGAAAALGFSACADGADDCRNTATCPVPDYCIEAGDARDELDGCF